MQTAALANQLSLFYLDESGFSNIPNVQRAWAPKGKPHAADASSGRQRVNNVIGALEFNSGRLWYDLHSQAVKRPQVTELIDRIARREQRMPLTSTRLFQTDLATLIERAGRFTTAILHGDFQC